MVNAAESTQKTPGRVLSVTESILAMMGLCFVVMLVAIDQTVVGTALPTIVSELHGFELYAWVATAYLLTSVITVPIFGRLGDFYGRRRFVLVSIVLYLGLCILWHGAKHAAVGACAGLAGHSRGHVGRDGICLCA